MSDRKTGDVLVSLPTDESQEFSTFDLRMFQKKKEKYHDDSDNESDMSDDSEMENSRPSMWSELKSTFIASLLYAILSLDSVDSMIRKSGMDGSKLFLVKIFLFAIIYFILRYQFL
jgi:hypothetical protein